MTFKVIYHMIKITKDNSDEFNVHTKKMIPDLIEDKKEHLNQMEENSINKILEFIETNPTNRYIVSHSGGKDSSITYAIWLKAIEKLKIVNRSLYNNLNWEIAFFNTSNETADTYKYIKQNLPKDKLNIINPDMGFYQWIINVKNYFVPSVFFRNCCTKFKEKQMFENYECDENIIMVTGLRKYESFKRSKYDYVMDYEKRKEIHGVNNIPKNLTIFAPVVEWEDTDVWLYLIKNKIPVNKQYYYGFNRTGCLICPFQNDYIDILTKKYYPTHWKRWEELLKVNHEYYKIGERLKWSVDEWIEGKWKQAKSREQLIVMNKPNAKNIKELAEVKGISEELAAKYFHKKCECGKNLNPTEVAVNLKFYGRNMIEDKMECKKCFMNSNDMKRQDYKEMVWNFVNDGCKLF